MSCRKKRCCGLTLVIVGIFTIVLGVLIGRLIVRRVTTEIESTNCIDGKEHSGYEDWTKSEAPMAVYFWHIRNKDGFLHKGERPQFEQRGPYMYKEETRKIDVLFDEQGFGPGHVSYKDYIRITYDKQATALKCPTCGENDQVTVINIGYLAGVALAGGDAQLALAVIPAVVGGYIKQLNELIGNQTLSFLGNVETVQSSLTPAFGSWLKSQASFVPIIAARGNANYTQVEMQALYNVLANSSLLLPSATQTTCSVNPTSNDCGLLMYLTAYMATGQTIATNASSPALTSLLAVLQQRINTTLCPQPPVCFEAFANPLIIPALVMFITQHLTMCSAALMDANNYGLVTTQSQKEIALGYTIDKLSMAPTYPHGFHVPGILSYDVSEAAARQKKKYTLRTCASSGDSFTWVAIDGQKTIPSNYFPKLQGSQREIKGYALSFKSVKEISPCDTEHEPLSQEYDLFMASAFHQLRIKYDKPVQHHGIHMHRYVIDPEYLKANNASMFLDGIIDLSDINGFPNSISLPGFLYGDKALQRLYNMTETNTPEQYGTRIDVEPVTGRAMDVKFRLQFNTVITRNAISVPRMVPLNVSLVDDARPYQKYVPIVWLERSGELHELMAAAINNQLFKVLDMSCTISVLIPVIGGLMLCGGGILLVIAYKKRSSEVTQVGFD